MRIKQKEVPMRFRRIAAERLESIRDNKQVLNAEDLYLGDEVCPIYRPDIDSPAYYEFQVHKATRENVDNRKDLLSGVGKLNLFTDDGYKAVYSTPKAWEKLKEVANTKLLDSVQGFIVVAAGGHDFPIPHWSLDSNPPSFDIEIEATKLKKKLAKVYKVDSLTYLGEDAAGNEIVHIGNMPALLKDFPTDLKKFQDTINSSVTQPNDPKIRFLDDSHKPNSEKTIDTGPSTPEFTFEGAKWEILKKSFKSSYAPLLAMLQDQAKDAWDIQLLIEKMGEGIIAGQVFNVVPLEKEFTVEVSGEAAAFVVLRVVKRPGGFSVIELRASTLPVEHELDLILQLTYGKAYQEQINLFVVNETAASESFDKTKK